MGEVGTWQLRDSYENLMGKKPARDWSWERTARELFREFDRSRDAAVGEAFEAGKKALAAGDFEGMRKAWSELLARDPDPEHRPELVTGFLAYAEKFFDERPAESREVLLRALRLTDDPKQKAEIESLILTQRAKQSAARGASDVTLPRRALELSPRNQHARELVEQLTHGKAESLGTRTRWIASGTMALVALAGLLTLLFRKKSAEPLLEPSPESAPLAPGASSALPEPPAESAPEKHETP
jgi:hypothetical protein